MKVEEKDISVAGRQWKEFTIKNGNGMEVSCLNYGGIITRILAPDSAGKLENVVIGYRNYEDYLDNPNFFGALIGRVAGRIADSSFELNGENYSLPPNEGENHLHGGTEGFHASLWDAAPFQTDNTAGVRFSLFSPDGTSGFPGNLQMTVIYTLAGNNEFSIEYEGLADRDTILTTTNHSYFNLSGNLKQDVTNHRVIIDSSRFVELDEQLIPTGKKQDVDNTVFDFRDGRFIKDGVESDDIQNKHAGNGYDHYFIFDGQEEEKVTVEEPESGRKLTVFTDQPGIVFYTGNKLDESLVLAERNSAPYLGVCLETQSSPASLEYEGFPSVYLPKDEKYYSKTTFQFKA